MPARLGLIALLGILTAVGLMAGYTLRHGQPAAAPAPAGAGGQTGPHGPGGAGGGPPAAQTAQTGTVAANGSTPAGAGGAGSHGPPPGRGPGAGSGFVEVSGEAAGCNSVGENGEPIGRNIKWLFDNHDVFRYVLHVYPENRTIVWIITAPSREALETLVSHIEQMECVVEHGGNPRPFDPLFKVDAEISSKYVHTEIKWLNDTAVEVVKVADNDCAFEVIKLHAEVVKGFFDTGRVEAQKIHEVPEEALEVCRPYLGES